jgi:hypothetical protein
LSSIQDNGDSWTTSNQIRKMLFPDVIIERVDKETATIVEEAIALLGTRGLREASEFIYARKVPLHVAKRVLLHPAERRKGSAS